MKNVRKRLGGLALGLVLLISSLTVAAGAAEVSNVTVEMRPNVEIVVDGVSRTFYNVKGQEVHPLYYQGTHYLPVRAIGELMGKNVNWDQSTLTISLAGTRTAGEVQGTPDTDARVRNITAQIRPDFSITVDGVKRTFTDAQGKTVYPMLYEGTNYLPVRAIGELMGKSVSWNGSTRIITLTSESLVTDADSFGPAGGTSGITSGSTSGLISTETAKSKALAHAGLTASQVTFLKAKLDWDDGHQIYEVEFYTKDYQEYDYEIDARTGAILSYDHDAETSVPQQSTSSGSYIGETKAKSIALSAAGVSSSQASGMRCHLERDDGRWEYSVEFWSGTMEYEFEIDAYTGVILSRDAESIYD